MELRVLHYFLAVAREESISGAAEYLHLTQPTLSRQLKDLEEELGKQLFLRGNRKITLTEEGMLLRKRAEEILELVQKTENEISVSSQSVSGDVYIGTGETNAVRLLARVARRLKEEHPQIYFHIESGDALDVLDHLEKGLIDFGVLIGQNDLTKYNHLLLPAKDTWGVLMRKDSPLAEKSGITAEDLWDKPLIFSRQELKTGGLYQWLKKNPENLNIVATCNLVYNASLMVDEGLGYAITLDKLINTSGSSNLVFKPLEPQHREDLHIIWKKYQIFSKAAGKFLEELQLSFAE